MWQFGHKLIGFALLLAYVMLVQGCFPSTDPASEGVTGSTTSRAYHVRTTGRVVDPSGNGIADVSVTLDNQITYTDADGYYDLREFQIDDQDQLAIVFTKEGYATNQKVIPVHWGVFTYSSDVTLIPYQHVGVVDASSTTTAVVSMPDPDDPSGAPVVDVSFPSGAIPATGPVTVSVVRGDPTLEEGRAIFPGEYMGTGSDDPIENTMLESIAFTEITLNDIDGNELTEMNAPVTVTVKLPAALQTQYNPGDTIPWWSYDETTGVWVREDADVSTPEIDDALIISQNGVLFGVAQVTHFSWWNIDQPITEHSCLCAEVVDGDGEPVFGATLLADGVTYNGQSQHVMTDTQGKACVTVKRSFDNTNREKVRLNVNYGGSSFGYSAADDVEGEAQGSPVIKTPTLYGNMTMSNPGVCLTVKKPVVLNFSGQITGTILNGLGEPIAGLTFFSRNGDEITTDEEGRFVVRAFVGSESTLYKPGLFSQSVTVTDADTPINVSINLPNQAPWFQSLTADINRTLTSAEVVTFTAQAVDPEEESLTYQWAITEGYSLNVAESGLSAIFTAPQGGTGTALVTVTVSDESGLQSQRSIPVSWGSADDSYNLKLMMLDNSTDKNPMEGIIVALHDPVSGAIVRQLTSDAQGVVDFGYIGANRATYSVLYSHTKDCGELFAGNSYLNTWVDVPVGSNTYYVEHGAKAIPAYEMAYKCTNISYIATYDVTVNNVPSGTQFWMNPFSPMSITNGAGATSGYIYPAHLNKNGSLDVLALVRDLTTYELVAYDVISDQSVVEGGHYVYNLVTDHVPLSVPLTIDIPEFNVANGALSTYSRIGRYNYYVGKVSTQFGTGNAFLIPEVERYGIYGVLFDYDSVGGDLVVEKQHQISSPTITIANGNFSKSFVPPILDGDTFKWSTETKHDYNAINMNFVCDNTYERGVVWNVLLDKNQAQWKLVEPPPEVSDCLNVRDKIGGYNGEYASEHYVEFSLVDLEVTTSRDDFWNLLINGNDLKENWGQRNEVYYMMRGAASAP